MKKLILIRHAKSDWHAEAATDFDRPLNKRGKKNAPAMGQRLAEHGCIPDLLLSSPAQRARETAEAVAKQLNLAKADISYDRSIYEATLETLIELVRKLDNELENVILIGHNPGISELGEWFTDDAPEWLPTCGLLALELTIDAWNDVAASCAYLVAYEYPKKSGHAY